MQSRLNTYNTLRQDYPVFTYESFSYRMAANKFQLGFSFDVSGKIKFEPELSFHNANLPRLNELSDEELKLFAFNLGMAELVSYWKATCSPEVIIKPAFLDAWQVEWWKKLYYKGLGEFFYTNGIKSEYDNFLSIQSSSPKKLQPANKSLEEDILLPVGGGKDSIVSMEILLDSGRSITPFVINPGETHRKVLSVAGFEEKDIVRIERRIDPGLLELNEKGYLNGHTPFSAVVAFTAAFAAYAGGKKYIALSNESSANEPTIPETGINHQYSKSVEFESDFRNYVKKCIHPGLEYFSLLRPLNELQIARLFAGFTKYHDVFRSCNAGSKQGIWCGHCPKCLFTYIILSPFLPPAGLNSIFNKNLLDDPSLKTIFRQLCGLDEEKPFECVGTLSEVNAALQETMKKHKRHRPELLKYYENLKTSNPPSEEFMQLMKYHDPDNFLPAEFDKLLMKWL